MVRVVCRLVAVEHIFLVGVHIFLGAVHISLVEAHISLEGVHISLEVVHISQVVAHIFLVEVHISLAAVHIFLVVVHISHGEVHISLVGVHISLEEEYKVVLAPVECISWEDGTPVPVECTSLAPVEHRCLEAENILLWEHRVPAVYRFQVMFLLLKVRRYFKDLIIYVLDQLNRTQPTFNYVVKTSLSQIQLEAVTKHSLSLTLSPSPTHIPLRCAGLERVLGLRGYL